MTVLPKLDTGLDVNVRFTGVSDFEYTPECSVFDLLGVPLYHGWLVDPQVRVGGASETQSAQAEREAKFCVEGFREVGSRLAWEGIRAKRLDPVQNSFNFHLFGG